MTCESDGPDATGGHGGERWRARLWVCLRFTCLGVGMLSLTMWVRSKWRCDSLICGTRLAASTVLFSEAGYFGIAMDSRASRGAWHYESSPAGAGDVLSPALGVPADFERFDLPGLHVIKTLDWVPAPEHPEPWLAHRGRDATFIWVAWAWPTVGSSIPLGVCIFKRLRRNRMLARR